MGSRRQALILLVEDDPGVARLEQLQLERAGYAVVTATTASRCLERVAAGGIDLIVLDQQLDSGWRGLDLFRQIKEAGHDVPAILVTGLQDEHLLVEALRAGVRDFVPKTPNFLNHLEPIVSRVIRQVSTERDLAESRILARESEARRRELEHEIASRKRVELALREAEENLRLMVESIKDFAIFTIDPAGNIVTWNSGAEQLFGYSEANIIGRSIAELFVPEDRAAGVPEQEIAAAAAKGRATDERWHIRNDGSRFFASGALAPIFDEDSNLRGFTGIVRDMTEFKKSLAERNRLVAELGAERALLNSLLDKAPVGLGFFDSDLHILRINPALKEMTGLDPADQLGHTLQEALPALESDFCEALRQVLSTGQSIINKEIDFEPAGKTARSRYWLCSFYPVKTADGTILGVGSVIADIDERKRMEEALRDADQRKDHFLAMLAHELRNPLAPISNAVQIMRIEGPSGANLDWSIDVISDQIKHMTRIVDDLLDVSRITRGTVVLRKESIELERVVDLAVQASRPLIENYKHELHVTLPPESVVLDVDPARLAQVLANLLNNAAKYTPEGGRIELSAALAGSDVLLTVRDNGIGIAPELLPTLFDLFVQADQSLSRSRGGLGIGLTVVRSLVEMHEGCVTVRSDGPGKGSEFTIRIPLPHSSAIAARNSKTPAQGPARALPRRRILVVDDNLRNAATLQKLLSALGQEVHTAHNGLDALEMARSHHPNVILLDIGLPIMDGYQVARICREDPALSTIILVAMTGYGKAEDRRRSRLAGFNAHLVKPVGLDDLALLLEHTPMNESP
jgi:PAS domain S-box-containing protein